MQEPMSLLASVMEPIRRLDLERFVALRASIPPVAVEMDRAEMLLVRVRRRRRGSPEIEAHAVRPMPAAAAASSVLRPGLDATEESVRQARALFESTGTRPGRVTLVLPDNLARVSLMSFPERPPNRRHLDEMVRFKLRKSVPFRLEEAIISYQTLPGHTKETHLLVALMLRSVVEQYEQVLEAAGARPGRVEISSLSLFNLCRRTIGKAALGDRDVALLNCARGYFSLLIVRGERLLFYRSKSLVAGDEAPEAVEPVLNRELATSLSYYQEKLGGQAIATTFVRDVTAPPGARAASLEALGFGAVVPVDLAPALATKNGTALDPGVAQRIASVAGAAVGRGD
jgi:type IV pilus assembly protein PilM